MSERLKPCPFCGGHPEIVTPEETDGQYSSADRKGAQRVDR